MLSGGANFNLEFVRQVLFVLTALTTLAFSTRSTEAENRNPFSPKTGNLPNIVLVYADDVDCETVFGKFPEQDIASMRFENLRQLAIDGVRFSNFHVTTPVCGPSRACLYTGQYAHRNGCRVNDPASVRALGFDGGYKTFNPDQELAIWMKNAGYTTAHVGKYLHADFKPDYDNGIEWKDIVPNGWDHFRLSLGCNYYGFPCFIKSTNEILQTGTEYRTDWDIRNAIDILNSHARGLDRNKPLMLCWTPIAAHITGNGQPMVAPRHESMYSSSEIPGLAERMNQTVSGQVPALKNLDIPNSQRKQYLTEVYRDRLRAIKSIDEGIGALRSELKKLGMLDNTIFVFTSDHGYRFAQHRHYGKRLPYDRITRVPFLVAGPGIPRGGHSNELLANIDIAPTLVALAGEEIPESCDGQSFAELIFDPKHTSLERKGVVIENWGEAVSHHTLIPATYNSLRMPDSIYTEWASGGREYYDLQSDPEQLNNLYAALSPQQKMQLASMLRNHRTSDSGPFLANTSRERMNIKRICGSIRPIKFTGIVEADAGAKKVELEFRCRKTGEYWSDSGWTSSFNRYEANLKQPDGLTSNWTFALDTSDYAQNPHSNIAARDVEMKVIATDLRDRVFVEKSMKFELSFDDPETTILAHQESEDGKTITIFGSASHLKNVNCVRVGLQNPATKEYWDGEKWTRNFCHHRTADSSHDQSRKKDRNWELTIARPHAQSVILVARAYSPSSHYDHTPALKTIELGIVRPEISVSQSLTGNSK